ncbi:MAG: HEPN domain-containing protein [Candidatus Caldarchaeum sp.]|nr:HEPN domain-containing protein [Candidatus Caldarchaeum sp.]
MHSITEVLKVLAQTVSSEVPEDVLVCASRLERHYLSARYPDTGLAEYNRWDAEEALECLRKVVA